MLNRLRQILQKDQSRREEPVNDPFKTHLAACVVLLEAAHIDNDCSGEEMTHIVDTLRRKFELSPEYTAELIELAGTERKNAIDLWQFTNHINQTFSKPEKIAVLEDVWGVILADGRLEMHEDHLAHQLANLLRLTHKDLMDAKAVARRRAET